MGIPSQSSVSRSSMAEEYDVTPDEAKADVADIINEWQQVGVTE